MVAMEKIIVKYRSWYKGVPPKPIKLTIPGWAGDSHDHTDGARPQPWHCPPFVEGSTYGLELLYPFDTECEVSIKEGKLVFAGDWEQESKEAGIKLPPFMSFAPGHFGFTSSLDIQAPSDYVIRLEPHPPYYTDETYTCPLAIAGNIQTEWWSRIFFVVFKSPAPGQRYIFRKNEPYAQILVVPKKISYEIKEMTPAEKEFRGKLEQKISKYGQYFVKNKWVDHIGHTFDDKYKILRSIYDKDGLAGVTNFLNNIIEKTNEDRRQKLQNTKIKPRILGIKKLNETLQNNKEEVSET